MSRPPIITVSVPADAAPGLFAPRRETLHHRCLRCGWQSGPLLSLTAARKRPDHDCTQGLELRGRAGCR